MKRYPTYAELMKKQPRIRNAQKVALDGHVFDSKKEAARYQDLKILELAGVIEDLEVHPKYHNRWGTRFYLRG
jgi:hypothetical protein